MKKLSKFLYVILSFVFVSTLTSGVSLSILNSQLTGGGVEESVNLDEGTESSDGTQETSNSESGNIEEISNSESGDVKTTDTDGNYWYDYYEEYDDSSTTIEISTAGQLAYLAYMVNSGTKYSGYVFQLTADLDMSAHYWVPIGGHNTTGTSTSTSYYFSGEFDGDSHTITGLDTSYATSSTTYNYMGLFGYTYGSSSSSYCNVHDVSISNATIVGYRYVGGVVGYAYRYTDVYSCYNFSSVTGSDSYVGGIVGYTYGYTSTYLTKIYSCENSGSVSGSSTHVGGIVGYAYYYTSIYNCENSGIVTGSSTYVGGVVGYVYYYSFVYSSENSGSVSGSSTYVGGIVGYFYGRSSKGVYDCYNYGSVAGDSTHVGGIVGYARGYSSSYYGDVYTSYNYGSVSGTSYIGGIVGYAGNYSKVYSSYNNSGSVSGTSYIGGIVGYSNGYAYATINSIYNCSNSIALTGSFVGGIVGYIEYTTVGTSSYSCTNTGRISGSDCVGGCIGYSYFSTYTYCTNSGTVSGSGNVGSIVGLAEDYALYDYWISDSSYYSSSWSGSGTSSDPYLIQSAADLALLSYKIYSSTTHYASTYFKQTCDIDLSAHYWMPIGNHFSGGITGSYYFSGIYDGGGYTISGLNTYYDEDAVTKSMFNYQGLFGSTYGKSSSYCNVHDINIEDSEVVGYYAVGAVVGYIYYYSNVYNCSNSSIVTAEDGFTGGIVGYCLGYSYSYRSNIYCCANYGTVMGGYDVGGIVGHLSSGYVHSCTNYGSVRTTSGTATGGIVGYQDTYSSVYRCCNSGSVSGSDTYIGGIVGYSDGYSTTYWNAIHQCYNIADISVSVRGVGGILGCSDNYTGIFNCYNIGNIKSSSYSVGGIVGIEWSYCYVYNCYNTGTISGSTTYGSIAGEVGYYGLFSKKQSYVYSCFSLYDYAIYGTLNYGTVSGCVYGSSYSDSAKDLGWYGANGGTISAYSWSSSYAWDFDDIWMINENYNDGYPILRGLLWSYLDYDSTNGYRSYEDGYFPQSVVASEEEVSYYCGDGTYKGISISYDESTNYLTLDGTATGTGWIKNYIFGYYKVLFEEGQEVTLTVTLVSGSYTSSGSIQFVLDVLGNTGGSTLNESNSSLTRNYVYALVTDISDEGDSTSTTLTANSSAESSGIGLRVGLWISSTATLTFEDAVFEISVSFDGSAEDLESGAALTGESYVVGSEKFSVWTYGGEKYVKVTSSGANAKASATGCTWFLVEPIVWIVAYGELPTSATTAVTAKVITLGAYSSSSNSTSFYSLFNSTSENSAAAISSGNLAFSTTDSITYDKFNTSSSQNPVYSVNLGNSTSSNTVVTSAGYRVASASEIDALGGSYAATCTDFVAFLLSGGTTTTGGTYTSYWTRDLAAELDSSSTYYSETGNTYTYSGALNNGVYVTSGGTLSNSKLKNTMGARLCMSV